MSEQTRAPNSVGRHVVILSHPDPDSFNHSVARTYCETVRGAGQEVVLRDLYAIGFDPVLKAIERPGPRHPHPLRDVADELEIIRRSDLFVLVYPIWFGSAPAMLKGYVDRVLGTAVVPQAIQEGNPTSLLGDKTLLSFTTSGTRRVWLDEQGEQSALETVFDRYLMHAFGMREEKHVHFDHITEDLTERFAAQHLQDVKDEAERACAEVTARSGGPLGAAALSDRASR
ncbi:NAD(P)H-dependent oxidoreductase [Sphingomonas sp. RT2P30]|uniref:NAD(P)H-dependent oxidoreductase n=1 Tax=Parasphingomonas halimpatiens TaxID=3096162 RepID=UPI002FCBF147